MTLPEIIYNIKKIAYGGGILSDDNRINDRLISFWIRYYRAVTIPQFTDWGKEVYPELYQDKGILTLISIDKAEDISVTWGQKVSTIMLDPMVELPKGRHISISHADKQTPIPLISAERMFLHQYRRFVNKSPTAYMIGNKLYVFSKANKIVYINIRAIFDDPVSIDKIGIGGIITSFNQKTDPYPITKGLLSVIIEQIMTKELNFSIQTAQDIINNAADETNIASGKESVQQR